MLHGEPMMAESSYRRQQQSRRGHNPVPYRLHRHDCYRHSDYRYKPHRSSSTAAISALDNALMSVNTLSKYRCYCKPSRTRFDKPGKPGAFVQAAESVIRDADLHRDDRIYKVSDPFTVIQAMLAQANVLPQNVLSLLQG